MMILNRLTTIWVDSEIQTNNSDKENKWTQSIAVGSKTFIETMKEALRAQAYLK
jgi:hypothetical protein